MPCETVKLNGRVVGVYCTRGRGGRVARCAYCRRPHTALCDYQPEADGRTCDKKLCEQHRARQGPDFDYCPDHARLVAANG